MKRNNDYDNHKVHHKKNLKEKGIKNKKIRKSLSKWTFPTLLGDDTSHANNAWKRNWSLKKGFRFLRIHQCNAGPIRYLHQSHPIIKRAIRDEIDFLIFNETGIKTNLKFKLGPYTIFSSAARLNLKNWVEGEAIGVSPRFLQNVRRIWGVSSRLITAQIKKTKYVKKPINITAAYAPTQAHLDVEIENFWKIVDKNDLCWPEQ